MYSSIETQATSAVDNEKNNNSNNNKYQYHLNAFTNSHSTACVIAASLSSSSASSSGVKNGDKAKSIIISNESHATQPSTLFTHNSRNKFSYGAYSNNATTSNKNDFEYNDKSKSSNYSRAAMVNDKIIPRGPYLQYKLSEKDNNGNYKRRDHKPSFISSSALIENGEKFYHSSIDLNGATTILPRAKILTTSLSDTSGVDYNLRTQTIGRFNPAKPTTTSMISDYKQNPKSTTTIPFVPVKQQMGYNSYTLPSTRRECQSIKRNFNTTALPSYITLENALSYEFFHFLSPAQGWALLCQSIQALQDLFLSEPPSINRIIPVITPNNFLLTSRGRVVYGLLTVDKYNDSINEYISDEFRQYVHGRKMNYNESDIEKMWIFSLGRTLMRALPMTTVPQIKMQSVGSQCAVVLQATIWKMCNYDVNERASLMFLLNIISDYCKNVHQSKPFSHIIMDLFRRVVQQLTYPTFNEKDEKHELNEQNENRRESIDETSSKDEIKSDTDSGRSSDYRIEDNQQQLSKPLSMELESAKFFSLPRPKYNPKPEALAKNEIENRRETRGGRRFTVDVNSNDVATALADIGIKSRSSNNLNVIHEGEMKVSTLPNMKIKKDVRIADVIETRNGPEFIMNSSSSVKVVDITNNKCLNKGVVKILLLNGKTYDITCDSISTTAQKIFETLIHAEQIQENYILGLCALVGGDFVFLPMDLKIYKCAPQMWIQGSSGTKKPSLSEIVSFTLYLRIKFFLPTLRMLTLESRHTLYLQLRKSVLENHILCTDDDLITLGGLALQAEVGDFQEEMKYVEYFTISHYLPDGVYQQHKELSRYLRNSHYSKRGLHRMEAEHNFIGYLQRMKEYGIHYMSAVWTRDDKIDLNVYVGIGLNGVTIFERYNNDLLLNARRNRDARKCNKRLLYEQFDWLEIENLCFSKQILCIVVRKLNINLNSNGGKNKDRIKFKLKMDSRKSFFAFSIASEHHKFYMKLKNSFMSIKSIEKEMNLSLSNECSSEMLNIKIDKPTKSNGLRVRNLKKSVLNDTRLMKLKDRILRRSKSTVCDFKRNAEEIANENNLNKENERPQFPSMIDLAVRSPVVARNKVKMGTRVFSSASQLNKSFESLSENYHEILRVDSWGALHLNHNEENFEEKSEEDNEAVVLHSSIKSINQANNFSMPNDTMSTSLAEKFENLSCTIDTNNRILSQLTIIKCPVFSETMNFKSQSLKNLAFSSNVDCYITGYSMGISIIQGQTDNYVYVKEIIKNGPGDRAGISVGDQIVSVDGTSLLNLPYERSLEILQNTGNEVNLIVSQVFTRKNVNSCTDDGQISTNLSTTNLTMTPSKSLPNLKNAEGYQPPKIVAILPKGSIDIDIPNLVAKPPRLFGQSRKRASALKYPTTPVKKDLKELKLTISPNSHSNHLSIASETDSLII